MHNPLPQQTGLGENAKVKTVTLYTDGACSGNPGPGGWGAILSYSGVEKELSGGERNTTNNRMELTAAIKALDLLNSVLITFFFKETIDIITDNNI